MNSVKTLMAVISALTFGFVFANVCSAGPMSIGFDKPYEVSTLVGTHVKNHQDEYLGRINDFVIDKDRIAFAILAHGGFLRMGEKLVVVPFSALSFDHTGGYFKLDTSNERLESAPVFKSTELASGKWAEDVFKYFGQQPYWTEWGYKEGTSSTMEKSEEEHKEAPELFYGF